MGEDVVEISFLLSSPSARVEHAVLIVQYNKHIIFQLLFLPVMKISITGSCEPVLK